jgi:hypothetical protein
LIAAEGGDVGKVSFTFRFARMIHRDWVTKDEAAN